MERQLIALAFPFVVDGCSFDAPATYLCAYAAVVLARSFSAKPPKASAQKWWRLAGQHLVMVGC